ncbi:MAG TPA: hypothetical protein VFV72_15945 [Candidatus Limnocylindrales bacterium]|nr:hypothetical protein [Candidatus Limnocylindrales bacterium]
MSLRRWRDSLGPPLLAVVAVVAVVIPAAASPTRMRASDALAIRTDAGALPVCDGHANQAPRAATAWYRLDPALDADGALTGWRFFAGQAAERHALEIALPVESFASGPRNGLVLVGADDGRRSSIRIVDIGRRCATALHEGPDLVRRAVLTPAADAIVEFRLDRRTRADLGVWLRPLDGSKPSRLVNPLAPSPRVGIVFSTDLRFSTDGRRLVITSCGEAACLTRLLDRKTGRLTTIDDEGVGETIAVVGDELVAYGGCASLPCRIVARNLASGRVRVLAERAGLASLTDGVLAYEDYRQRGRVVIRPLGGGTARTVALETGMRLVPGESRALAGIEGPVGSVAIAPEGRPSWTHVPATFVEVHR